ncbi:hypothetical protein V6N12_024344 [Hibiscus sabdariffa]|uniref:Uncharacterized protein n=1 Tax=Hibiscus sabdariffa TaxID=183260 RepID=A0ABR2G0G9_9ROSI
MILMLGCPWDYSDPIAGLIEFPFLPRPRISADVCFSADVFSAPFWVFSFGAASVQLLSLRFCCLYVPQRFISKLGIVPSISDAVELYCDNNGAIAQAKEPISHHRSKQILKCFHLIG